MTLRLPQFAVLGLLLLATGCSSLQKTALLDPQQVASVVRQQLENELGTAVASVACPSDIEAEQGNTFRCTVVGVDGTTAVVDVAQTDDAGRLSVEFPFLPRVADAEGMIEQQLGGGATVECPELIPVKAGGTFTCEATAKGDTATVTGMFKDDYGTFEIRAVKP